MISCHFTDDEQYFEPSFSRDGGVSRGQESRQLKGTERDNEPLKRPKKGTRSAPAGMEPRPYKHAFPGYCFRPRRTGSGKASSFFIIYNTLLYVYLARVYLLLKPPDSAPFPHLSRLQFCSSFAVAGPVFPIWPASLSAFPFSLCSSHSHSRFSLSLPSFFLFLSSPHPFIVIYFSTPPHPSSNFPSPPPSFNLSSSPSIRLSISFVI